ncbi:TIGR01459 family HAD-type hydrolase [Pararhizobium haloflavum]|uniref:TIGR01459 family HAD-type hydrolase n=1 Tax=Pararhizobium haloflavum TaxID=2037914 RepID=UPI000C19E86F|nr:TIGR01459 family HAD-type hydrolase [Pararhizobium haloflavum]
MASEISRLNDLHANYDALLCDVWGVLHNGVAAWDDACRALQAAREAGLTVVLITNSPRRNREVALQLDGIGVPRSAYDRIVTSGDVTRKLIAAASPRLYFLGLDRDLTLLEGLDVERVDAERAETILCTGPFDDENDKPDDYRTMFAPWVERGVPFICANPDLIVERGDRLVLCAGALAAVYADMGGEVRLTGKPYPAMYDAALEHVADLRGAADPVRALAIGDGMPTDVKGAEDYGLDLLYVAAGIHARDYASSGRIDPERLDAFLKKEGAAPDYWMPRLA